MSVLISDSFKIRESTSNEWENVQFSINSPGVPVGGQVEQFLVKNSNVDYDTKWATPNARYFFSLIWGLIYPVGSYYWSSESTSPEVLFGGTWERVKDTFILAAGDDYTTGDSGGETSVMLTAENIPALNITLPNGALLEGKDGVTQHNTTANWAYGVGNWDYWGTGTPKVTTVNGTTSHNNMPPYIVAYCWHRIA